MEWHNFILFMFVIEKSYSEYLPLGAPCTLKTSRDQGKCIRLNSCDKAQKDLDKHNISPQFCGFDDHPLVCCSKRETGQISKKQCREYSRLTKVLRPSVTLKLDAQPIIVNECGHKVIPLIVGGKPAGDNEFPHMAAIGFESNDGNIKWSCGGTLISDKYILTAAHCLAETDNGIAKYVRIGGANLIDNRSKYIQKIKIDERIVHPQYIRKYHYHDIGLIKLEQPAKLTSHTVPACLYLEHYTHTKQAIATGWGYTENESVSQNKLRKVTLDLIEHSDCNYSYRRDLRKLKNGIMDNIQLCAGSTKTRDTCQGDSGGPLQIYHDSTKDNASCMYDVIGITAFGKGCLGNAGVYTRVSNYIEWIENIVWPED